MRHRWATISFLHWPYPAEEIQRRLPSGLEVEPWDGQAWVGLVPFEMTVRPPVGPGTVRFPETNVRTYVIGPDGSPLTIADLPAPGTKRWVIRRKAEVVAAVRGGLLSLEEACSRYTLTVEEFLGWQYSIDRHGLAGLRTTRIQQYRQ